MSTPIPLRRPDASVREATTDTACDNPRVSKPSTIVNLRELRQSCADCALSQLCLPASIGGADLERLDDIVRQRMPLDRGGVLFREGSAHPSLFVVRSGSLKTFVSLPEGDTQILGFHIAGELVGLDGLAGNGHQCTAEALERSSLCEVPFASLSEVAAKVPGLQHQLFRVMSREFVREQQHPVMMGRKQAMSRLAIFLRSLSERLRGIGHDPLELNLSMSRQELANYLGLVIETVSRLFSRLQAQGVLAVDRRIVRILQPAALAALAEKSDDEGK
ncbi:helix-turn-helix domain-containing protein [Dokdonella sp. MW10]|uniref:helix-turn-helix domain-containing protein n=1 Tax=Dokdonella sp. MW10 TaxID=2992926 RepID=UPI003F819A8D